MAAIDAQDSIPFASLRVEVVPNDAALDARVTKVVLHFIDGGLTWTSLADTKEGDYPLDCEISTDTTKFYREIELPQHLIGTLSSFVITVGKEEIIGTRFRYILTKGCHTLSLQVYDNTVNVIFRSIFPGINPSTDARPLVDSSYLQESEPPTDSRPVVTTPHPSTAESLWTYAYPGVPGSRMPKYFPAHYFR